MNAPLRYSREELMKSHPYERPHEAGGYRLHGGFVAGGYVSPRLLNRAPAVKAWGEALEKRGWPLIDATGALLARDGYPSFAQHKMLLSAGLTQSLWDSLSVTGIIEGRGQNLCNVMAPDFSALVAEDISQTAAAHLNLGLLYAHGADEGGDPARPGEGAHDQMWFAVRDLAFGAGRHPVPEAPASISREVEGREMPELPEGVEQFVKFLMNVLMIEIRAESFFALCVKIFRDPELFAERRDEAEEAATIVERIRADEAIHVAYLRVLISELRSFTFKLAGGKTRRGAEIIDPLWASMVEWHGRTEREIARDRTRANFEPRVLAAMGEGPGRAFLARFDALEIPGG
ncbi:MAG: hypothetical protein ACREEX_13750, partial [Caulobacteraceae bacterium]